MNGPAKATISTGERPSWKLARAVLIYAPATMEALRGQGGVYATLHEVENSGRDFRLAAGVPATREACADLARALGATSTLSGFVPPHLLYLGAKSLIWWRPPGRARLFFDTTKDLAGDQVDDKEGRSLIGKRSAVTPHPGLVFAVTSGRWFVYAVKGADRPDARTGLFRAPYFNVWAEGQICTGNVRLPETLSTAALERYERAFFDSEFTHPNLRGRGRLVNGEGPYTFWQKLLDGATGRDQLAFPESQLVDLKLSVEGLAKRLEKDRGDTAP